MALNHSPKYLGFWYALKSNDNTEMYTSVPSDSGNHRFYVLQILSNISCKHADKIL